MLSNLPKELQPIVAFIRSKCSHQPINKFTDEQIACYFLEQCGLGQALAVYKEQDSLEAIVFFAKRDQPDELYIEQIWCDGKNAFRSMLKELAKKYPSVTKWVGYRRKQKKLVIYPVETLVKISS